jgi:hypothetical protein
MYPSWQLFVHKLLYVGSDTTNFLYYFLLYCCPPLSFLLQGLDYPFFLRLLVFFDLVMEFLQVIPVLNYLVVG